MSESSDPDLPVDLIVPLGRDRLGRAHQVRVDIAIAFAMVPAWVRRALVDHNPVRARGARAELVERIAVALERRFRITWRDGADDSENARAPDAAAPLFGGPQQTSAHVTSSNCIDSGPMDDGT